MKVLFLHIAPPPKIDNTDAVFNEISLIKKRVEFDDIYLMPFQTPISYYPRFMYGLHHLLELRKKQARVDVCHIFSPFLYYFPILNFIKKPIIYTVLSSDGMNHFNPKCESLARIIVSNDRTSQKLVKTGLNNITVIKPGIKFNAINSERKYTLAEKEPFKIIFASAPWTKNQIKSKGIIALLKLAKYENLRLTFVLRGLYGKEIDQLIEENGVGDKVQVINRVVDVPELMQQHHAVVLLSEESSIVKSYPHSLIEGLSAGIPVIVSDTIAMADMVQGNKMGEVVAGIAAESLSAAVEKIRTNYREYVENISKFNLDIFSPEKYVDNVVNVYEEVLSEHK